MPSYSSHPESAASRYDREFLQQQDKRKLRTLDLQSSERKNRRFVNRETGATAVSDAGPSKYTTADVLALRAKLTYAPA